MAVSTLSSYIPDLSSPQFRVPLLASAGLISVTAAVLYRLSTHEPYTPPKPIPSPLKTVIPKLSASELAEVPYAPDALPGARDVPSPYGSIRVYEWGPEDGRKVLLIHGISTPCIALGNLAQALAAKGCRVMLFDLFGRGYSDTPPDLAHDIRLYASQILIVLSSSPLAWTSFSLIGYSLGGGISTAFTAYFPHLITSLILLAPSGLIRPYRINASSKLIYGNVLPETLIEYLVKKRLQAGPLNSNPEAIKTADDAATAKASAVKAVEQEVPPPSDKLYASSTAALSKRNPAMSVARAVHWQVGVHQGFVAAFISAIRYAPISGQHQDWRTVGQRLQKQLVERNEGGIQGVRSQGMERAKVLMILGEDDAIIIRDEVIADATEALGGEDHLDVRLIDAGHEFPVTKTDEVAEYIAAFWGFE